MAAERADATENSKTRSNNGSNKLFAVIRYIWTYWARGKHRTRGVWAAVWHLRIQRYVPRVLELEHTNNGAGGKRNVDVKGWRIKIERKCDSTESVLFPQQELNPCATPPGFRNSRDFGSNNWHTQYLYTQSPSNQGFLRHLTVLQARNGFAEMVRLMSGSGRWERLKEKLNTVNKNKRWGRGIIRISIIFMVLVGRLQLLKLNFQGISILLLRK